jgi:acid phosphatase
MFPITKPLVVLMALAMALRVVEVGAADKPRAPGLNSIQHIVVIYAENRSFDNLYGLFPGADGIANAKPEQYEQRDRNGALLPFLPPVWQSPAAHGAAPRADTRFPAQLPNRPFAIDDPAGAKLGLDVPSRDLVHRYYQHIEQINGGRLDQFAAVSDAGALSMGHYNGASLELWKLAQEYTLADHFFMGAFGGSFLNHFWLVCACTPEFKDAPPDLRAELDEQGRLRRSADSPARAVDGPPLYVADRAVTPDGYAVNTVQPPFQPSGIAPLASDPSRADPAGHPLPPQTATTIGDTLSARSVTWAWYAGAWRDAQADAVHAPGARSVIYKSDHGAANFQPHHQPFNYFAKYAPGTAERLAHLKDAEEFFEAIDYGALEEVSFYKPSGRLNQHPGYTDIESGDKHIAEVVRRIQASTLWPSTLIIITYDENGGLWDHVAPPQGDRFGPGTRIPAIIVSPFARKHYVDSTVYDTTSIAKLITRRYNLAPLPGVRAAVGDLTAALDIDTAPSKKKNKKKKADKRTAHDKRTADGKRARERQPPPKQKKSDLQIFDSP